MEDGVEQSHYFPVILLLDAWAGCVTERVRKESMGNTAELPDGNKGLQWRQSGVISQIPFQHQAVIDTPVRWEAFLQT